MQNRKPLRPSWVPSFASSPEAEYATQDVTWDQLIGARRAQAERRKLRKKAAEKFLSVQLDEETRALIPTVRAIKKLTRIDAMRALLGPDRDMLIKAAKALNESFR